MRRGRSACVSMLARRRDVTWREARAACRPTVSSEKEDAIPKDAERLINRYHDNFAACDEPDRAGTLFAILGDGPNLMRDAAALARQHAGVHLHSHLAEELFEETYAATSTACGRSNSPNPSAGLDPDVWFAHSIFMTSHEIKRFAETGTGVAHCPSAKHAIAARALPRSREMLDAGVRVGLGVDGSASNDTSNLFMEARLAMMLQRVGGPITICPSRPAAAAASAVTPKALSAREALEMATRGGAAILCRDDIGYLAPGMSADFIAVRLKPARPVGYPTRPAGGVADVRTVPGRLPPSSTARRSSARASSAPLTLRRRWPIMPAS